MKILKDFFSLIGMALLVILAFFAIKGAVVYLNQNSNAPAELTKEVYLQQVEAQGDTDYYTAGEAACIYDKMIDHYGVQETYRIDKQATLGNESEQIEAGEKFLPFLEGCISY